MTRSSSTRSAPVASGSRDPASSSAPAGSVNARVSRSATVSARAPTTSEQATSRQQRPMPFPIATSVMPWPPAIAALTRAVAKLVPLHVAHPVGLGGLG